MRVTLFKTCFLLSLTRSVIKLSIFRVQALSKVIRIGTRPSPLALVQARTVIDGLQKIAKVKGELLEVQIVEIQSSGDQNNVTTKNVPLAVQAVDFTGTLDQALINDKIDIAVHSLKDIPPSSRWYPNLLIACCLPRENPMDVLVSEAGVSSIQSLKVGSRVGTSSARRQAQILSARSDLEITNLRGNVEARLKELRCGTVDALILAAAGLNRLLLSDNETKTEALSGLIVQELTSEEMLCGPCQGIIGVVCRSNDTSTLKWIIKLDDEETSLAAATERSFFDTLDSFRPKSYSSDTLTVKWTGRPPIAALMKRASDNTWTLEGKLLRPDGSKELCCDTSSNKILTVNDAMKLGKTCATDLLARARAEFYQKEN